MRRLVEHADFSVGAFDRTEIASAAAVTITLGGNLQVRVGARKRRIGGITTDIHRESWR
jgi:hypothetical protein